MVQSTRHTPWFSNTNSSSPQQQHGDNGHQKQVLHLLMNCQLVNDVIPHLGLDPPPPQQDLTLLLPSECLSAVFAKLPASDRNNCSLVCKRWHSVDATSRGHATLEARHDLVKHIKPLLLRFDHLTSISLKCPRHVLSIDDSALALVAKMSPNLHKLKLKSCRAITDAGLEHFSKACPSLRKLSCSSCGFGAIGLNAIVLNCGDLEDLSVKRFKRLLENPPLDAIASGKGKLRRLSLKDVCNAQFFGTLISSAKGLRSLVLVRNPGYWDHLFTAVSGSLGELSELRCDSLHMGDTALLALSKACKKLEVLYLVKPPLSSSSSECTGHGLGALFAGCGASLKRVYLDDRRSGRLGDAGFLSMAKNCKELKDLILIGVNASRGSLLEVASGCTALQRMALCHADSIGDAEIRGIGSRASSLKKLCIKNCPVSDHGLASALLAGSGGFPGLVKLKVKKCAHVSRAGVSWLRAARTDLVVSMDDHDPPPNSCSSETNGNGNGNAEGGAHENHATAAASSGDTYLRVISSPTAMPCGSQSSTLLKSRFSLAATNLLRKLPKSSSLSSCSPMA